MRRAAGRQGGKRVLGVDLGRLDEGQQGRVGRAELLRHLLGEGHRDPEPERRGDREPAPSEDLRAVRDGAQEHRLQVKAEQQGSLGGSVGLHVK